MGFRGLDTRSTAPTVEDARASDLFNVKLSATLNLKKRYGKSVINTTLDDLSFTSPAVTGIFDAEYSTGSKVLVFVGNKLKYNNTGTWTDATGGATVTTGQDYQWQCVMANDSAVCTNNQDAPLQVDSSILKTAVSFTGLSASVTKAKAVIWYRNYLIWGNTTETSARPTRFRWSDVGTINTYTQANFVDIASLSGDEIVGFAELYGELYIFMRKSIWKATLVGGNDTFIFTKLIEGVGVIARDSIRVVTLPQNRMAVIFLNENKKVYLFNGVSLEDIGQLIQPTLDSLNAARLQYAVSAFDDKDYFLSVSSGGISTNDLTLDLQTEIGEWTRHNQIDANAFARVKESTSLIKTYAGNYNAFVYWMDDPDKVNDVSGATGIIDSTGIVNTTTQTGAQILIDSGLTTGIYTGAIIRITSGTGAGQEAVVLTSSSTGVVVTSALSVTPDSTSNYSIGDIDAFYTTKWYDFGDAARFKTFRTLMFWAKESTDNEVDVSYSEDFGAQIGSETKSLSPSSSSIWDTALWDVATWGTTGDKLYTSPMSGMARVVNVTFAQSSINKTFNIYGYHFLADWLDRE